MIHSDPSWISFLFGFGVYWVSSDRPDLSSTVVDTVTEKSHSQFDPLVFESEFHLL